jgi:hypothetical protein
MRAAGAALVLLLPLLLASGRAQAASLVGHDLAFEHFQNTPEGRVILDSASFQVGPGAEHTVLTFLSIDVSADEILLSADALRELPFAFSTLFEFEILGSLRFSEATFDQDGSTFSGDLDPSRLQVNDRFLTLDMQGLSSSPGAVLVIDLQVVPEPGTGALIAVGLLCIGIGCRERAA